MHNSFTVHMLKCSSNLTNKVPNLPLFELNVFFIRSFDKKLQVALLSPLDCDEKLIQFVVNKPT